MTNQLTTIASLPRASGSASQLPPEVGDRNPLASLTELGYTVNDEGFIEALNAKNALVAKFWRGEQ